jgi:hypothetical protein
MQFFSSSDPLISLLLLELRVGNRPPDGHLGRDHDFLIDLSGVLTFGRRRGLVVSFLL